MTRSKTVKEYYSNRNGNGSGSSSEKRLQTEISHDPDERKHKLSSQSREINDKLAALKEQWSIVKKNDLEPIKEFRTQKEADEAILKEKKAAEQKKQAPREQRQRAIEQNRLITAQQTKSNASINQKVKQKPNISIGDASESNGHNKATRHAKTGNQSAKGTFSISKGLEELENIKKKMNSSKINTKEQRRPSTSGTETPQNERSSYMDEEDSKREKKGRSLLLKGPIRTSLHPV